MVYGWDKDCERDPDWAAAVQADPHQPFYHVLPDEGQLYSSGDCLSVLRCYVLKLRECGYDQALRLHARLSGVRALVA